MLLARFICSTSMEKHMFRNKLVKKIITEHHQMAQKCMYLVKMARDPGALSSLFLRRLIAPGEVPASGRPGSGQYNCHVALLSSVATTTSHNCQQSQIHITRHSCHIYQVSQLSHVTVISHMPQLAHVTIIRLRKYHVS